jgi:DNA-binding CsgD family transcriptional regulator
VVDSPALRGRQAELAVLRSALAESARGRGAVVLLEGEAGLGKTRLLATAAELGRTAGFTVAAGGAAPGERTLHMALITQALLRLPEIGPAALPDLGAHPDQENWFLHELEMLLQERAQDAPLVVALDDLQWADRGSLDALRALVPRLLSAPILWVLAYRPSNGSPTLAALLERLGEAGARRLPLGRLGPDDVLGVATDVLGAAPGERLRRALGRAEGHPFLLVDLLHGLRDEGRVDETADLRSDELPLRVRDTTRARLAGLSPATRQTAGVASVLGRRFAPAELQALVDLPAGTVAGAVRELLAADVLMTSGGALCFRHDLVCEAVFDGLPTGVRRTLQRAAVDVRIEAGATPVEVADMLAASARPGDAPAAELLLSAARALGPSDPAAGADLARRGFDVAPEDAPQRAALAVETAQLLHAAGRGAEGRAFVDAVLPELFDPERQAEVLLTIAWMFSAAPDETVRAGRTALGLPGVSPALRARHLGKLLHSLVIAGRAEEAEELREDAIAAAALAEDDHDATFALVVGLAGLELGAGRFAALEVRIHADIEAYPDDPVRRMIWTNWLADAAGARGDYAAAMAEAEANAAVARAAGQAWEAELWEQRRGHLLLGLGRPADAIAALEGLSPLDEGTVVSGGPSAMALLALGRAALHVGDARLTRVSAAVARRMLDASEPEIRRHGAWLLALQALAAGDPRAAREAIARADVGPRASPLPTMVRDVLDPPQLVRVALAADDGPLAARAVADAEAVLSREPDERLLRAAVLHARGLVDDDERALEEAAAILRASPRRLALASVLEDLGRLRAARGARDAAVTVLTEALGLLAQAEAAWDAGRVRGRLRALGVRSGRPRSPALRSGWESLTRSELAVVELVAQGLTNRQVAARLFLSPHTVSTHLRHSFTKLGVRSRFELAQAALGRTDDSAAHGRD